MTTDATGTGEATGESDGTATREDADATDARESDGDGARSEHTGTTDAGSAPAGTTGHWAAAGTVLALASAAVLVATTPVRAQLVEQASFLASLAAGYGLLIATSGWVVRGALWFAGVEPAAGQVDTGRAVGKVENVLVLTLALLGAYTALAVVFAAKSIVRWQDTASEDTTYYLTGSIANVTYSLGYAALLIELLGWPPA